MSGMFLDSHAHLEVSHYGEDLPQVIQQAWDADVHLILAIGNGTPQDHQIETTISIAERYDFIYATVGVHPHDAGKATFGFLTKLRKFADHPKVVAWGEIGLDYHYDFSPRTKQHELLEQQLALAEEAELPVIFHCREAEKDLAEIIHKARRDRPWGVLHSFTGSLEHARRVLDWGMYISFSGILTFKNASELRETAREIPADRLLVETDSPYLAPVPHRGKRNEPRYVCETASVLARLRGLSVEALMEQIRLNFFNLFGVGVLQHGHSKLV